MRIIQGIILFLLSTVIGVLYLSLGKGTTQNRNIASIELDFEGDYSYLSGEAFKNAVSKRIIEESYIEKLDQDNTVVNIAAFKLRSNDADHIDSCEVYSSIEMQFYAEGVVISGEVPTLHVEATCITTSEDHIQTMVIPVERIKALSTDQVVNIPIEYQNTKMTFSDLGNFWPETWIAQRLTFVSFTEDVTDLVIEIENLNPNIASNWILTL